MDVLVSYDMNVEPAERKAVVVSQLTRSMLSK